MSDAETTLKFLIRDALASTAHFTGVIPHSVNHAVDAVYDTVIGADARWALEEIIGRQDDSERRDSGISLKKS